MRRTFGLIAVILTGVVAASCGSTRPSHFYALEVPGASASAPSPLPVTILVGRVTASHVLRDDRIAYRNSPVEIGMYEYHRWSEPPTTMMEALLVRRLRADGRYRSVQSLSSNAEGDYILRGRLHQFEEVSNGTSITARVSLEIELYEKKSGTVVWNNLFNAEEPVAGKEVPNVVDAINKGTQKTLDAVAAGVAAHLSKAASK